MKRLLLLFIFITGLMPYISQDGVGIRSRYTLQAQYSGDENGGGSGGGDSGDPCDIFSDSYNPNLCDDDGDDGDPCDIYSPNYNPDLCEDGGGGPGGGGDPDYCNPESPDYEPFYCPYDPCDPSNPYYDPYYCESEDPCDPSNPYYDPYYCESEDPCDPNSPYYDPYYCDSGDPCDPYSSNYNPNLCGGGGEDPCVTNNSIASISWGSGNYSVTSVGGSSTTNLDAFTVNYSSCPDIQNQVWRLRVDNITGNAQITVDVGGNRDPYSSPPQNQVEADDAVREMSDYYTRGGRGTWHTEAASKAHEEYHYSQLKCASEYYWGLLESCLEQFTVPLATYPNATSALTALKGLGVDWRINQLRLAALTYVVALGDGPGDNPYKAGQLVLNQSIIHVQNLAASKGWTVPTGVPSVSLGTTCFNSFPSMQAVASCP